MGTLTADCPRLDAQCDHKLATSCRLTSTLNCCACADERPHSLTYRVYIDGIGFVQRGTRWQGYCWFCKGRLFLASVQCLQHIADHDQNSGVIALPLPNLHSRSLKHVYPRYRIRRSFSINGSSSIKAIGSQSILTVRNNALQYLESLCMRSAQGSCHEH